MSEGIERRTLLGASGAMFALAACKSESESDDTAKIFSPCTNYGDDAKQSPNGKFPWRPLHYCVVYINLDGSKLIVKHAYYESGLESDAPESDKPIKKTEALAALGEMARSGKWPGKPLFPEDNFTNFWFGSQQEIYVLIDGILAEVDSDNLIVFSANKTKPQSIGNPQENDTFYNAQIIPETVNGKKILFFQNWFLDKNNGPIKKGAKPWKHNQRPSRIYAMNIHMLLGDAKIPGVIDPDTGNGSGNEP